MLLGSESSAGAWGKACAQSLWSRHTEAIDARETAQHNGAKCDEIWGRKTNQLKAHCMRTERENKQDSAPVREVNRKQIKASDAL